MYSRITKWLTTKPATKAAWLGLILALTFNSYVTYQNSQTIKSSQESVRIAQDSLFLSISPSVNVKFPKAWEEQNIQIQNTSPFSLDNIDVYIIQYKIEKDEIIQRVQASGPAEHFDYVESNHVLALKLQNIFKLMFYEQNTNQYYSLVIISYRKIDTKRFVHIEPFGAAIIESQITLFPLYSGKGTGITGPPDRMVKVINEIETIENTLFRSSKK